MSIQHINKSNAVKEIKKEDFVQFMYNGKSRVGVVEFVQPHKHNVPGRGQVVRDYMTIEHLKPADVDDKKYSSYTLEYIQSNILVQSD